MDLGNIEKLVNIIEKSSMLEFSIQEGDTKIKMSRRGTAGEPGAPLTVVKTEVPAEDTVDENYIISPIVGTFYSAPAPDAPAFVKVGDVVKAGQTVCILEAMKLMNEIESDYDCEIEAVLVSNEQKVEARDMIKQLAIGILLIVAIALGAPALIAALGAWIG